MVEMMHDPNPPESRSSHIPARFLSTPENGLHAG